MIYEFRTYDLKPGSLPETIKRFGEAYEHRKKYSELAAFWYTDIGPLNRIIHAWPYADVGERERLRAEAQADPNWPPDIGEFLVTMHSEIFVPFPFSAELKPGKFGPIYELRSYIVKPGSMPATMKRWEGALEGRLKLSPLAAVMQTDNRSPQQVHPPVALRKPPAPPGGPREGREDRGVAAAAERAFDAGLPGKLHPAARPVLTDAVGAAPWPRGRSAGRCSPGSSGFWACPCLLP